MAITKNDVKLLKSERLLDEDDGGGRATGEAIVDNELNNLFPNISRLDRTLGRVSLRKIFAGVVTENADPYMGAHAIITRTPRDELVHALLFNTGSQTDERLEAQSFIEGYVVPSLVADWELLGDQFRGQRSISGIQHESMRVPETGDVYLLQDGENIQYVRATSVEHEMRTYYYEYNNQYVTFQRRYLQIGISAPLLHGFPGGPPTPVGTGEKNLKGQDKSQVISTQVADSARYYGVSALRSEAQAGVLELNVNSVYARLVPSSIRESGLVDQIAGSRRRYNVAASTQPRTLTVTFSPVADGHSVTYLGTGALRSEVQLVIGSAVYADDGAGEMVLQSGPAQADRITIDYETGRFDIYSSRALTGTASATYRIATTATGQTVTGMQTISLVNRGFAYTFNFSDAKPRPGTLVISYMALGKWYELRDQGNGELTGEGTGTVNFATGSCSITVTAMPDADTAIVFAYVAQDDFNFVVHSGSLNPPVARIEYQLPHKDLKKNAMTVATYHGGERKAMIVASGNTLIGGSGTGKVNFPLGRVSLELYSTIDQGSEIFISYWIEEGEEASEMTVMVDGDDIVTGVIPGAPLEPGGVAARWAVGIPALPPVGDDDYSATVIESRDVYDDGTGSWVGIDGSIDYETGVFTLRAAGTYEKTETVVTYEVIENG